MRLTRCIKFNVHVTHLVLIKKDFSVCVVFDTAFDALNFPLYTISTNKIEHFKSWKAAVDKNDLKRPTKIKFKHHDLQIRSPTHLHCEYLEVLRKELQEVYCYLCRC